MSLPGYLSEIDAVPVSRSHDTGEAAGLLEEAAAVLERMEKIQAGELRLKEELNAEWEDGDDEDVEACLYEDPEGVLRTIEQACGLVRRCADAALYRKGYEIFSRLLDVTVTLESSFDSGDKDSGSDSDCVDDTLPVMEWGGFHSGGLDCQDEDDTAPVMGWEDLLRSGLLETDARQLALDGMYLAYHFLSLAELPGALLDIFERAGTELTLEMLWQARGQELPRWTEFLSLWTEYLGGRTGMTEERLLTEVLELQKEEGLFIEAARRYVSRHPQLCAQLLHKNLAAAGDDARWEALGKEALESISPVYRIRSRIALLTAVYALRQNRREAAEAYWLEAFRSETSLTNYLRLRLESKDFANYREEAREIFEEQHKKGSEGEQVLHDVDTAGKSVKRPGLLRPVLFPRRFPTGFRGGNEGGKSAQVGEYLYEARTGSVFTVSVSGRCAAGRRRSDVFSGGAGLGFSCADVWAGSGGAGVGVRRRGWGEGEP